jgi:hypothetical protein
MDGIDMHWRIFSAIVFFQTLGLLQIAIAQTEVPIAKSHEAVRAFSGNSYADFKNAPITGKAVSQAHLDFLVSQELEDRTDSKKLSDFGIPGRLLVSVPGFLSDPIRAILAILTVWLLRSAWRSARPSLSDIVAAMKPLANRSRNALSMTLAFFRSGIAE